MVLLFSWEDQVISIWNITSEVKVLRTSTENIVIKQDQPEVGSNMLLVSDYFLYFDIMSIEFKTRHLRTY